ncbi:Uncharacterised protein [Vibrio cholerae]|nr:Uncharacterised protein [Vibrio cholerae]CSI50690.1 Uncharacterised protein [Vibrio cholerae]
MRVSFICHYMATVCEPVDYISTICFRLDCTHCNELLCSGDFF